MSYSNSFTALEMSSQVNFCNLMTACVHEIVFSLRNNDYEKLFAARIVQVAKG